MFGAKMKQINGENTKTTTHTHHFLEPLWQRRVLIDAVLDLVFEIGPSILHELHHARPEQLALRLAFLVRRAPHVHDKERARRVRAVLRHSDLEQLAVLGRVQQHLHGIAIENRKGILRFPRGLSTTLMKHRLTIHRNNNKQQKNHPEAATKMLSDQWQTKLAEVF
jgi:hypothetical protein